MCTHMNFETTSSGIALSTDVTLERLFAGVNQLMSLQVPLRNEFLSAALEVA